MFGTLLLCSAEQCSPGMQPGLWHCCTQLQATVLCCPLGVLPACVCCQAHVGLCPRVTLSPTCDVPAKRSGASLMCVSSGKGSAPDSMLYSITPSAQMSHFGVYWQYLMTSGAT